MRRLVRITRKIYSLCENIILILNSILCHIHLVDNSVRSNNSLFGKREIFWSHRVTPGFYQRQIVWVKFNGLKTIFSSILILPCAREILNFRSNTVFFANSLNTIIVIWFGDFFLINVFFTTALTAVFFFYIFKLSYNLS